MSIYLDCNATTPIEAEVSEAVRYYTEKEFGNAGSRTHDYGTIAKKAVQKARKQVTDLLPELDSSDVIFTSGATESNNIALLGLLNWARENGKKHILTTSIEHKAILEPLAYAESIGFDVERISPNDTGAINATDLLNKVRKDTFLVSVMHVNNETGIIQPIDQIANGLPERECYLHVDAAQGYGKEFDELSNNKIDLISISGHKIYGPKGVGALIMRRRKFKRAPITPIMYGGGQERGLRPGTLPVPLIAGLGIAAELCQKNYKQRNLANKALREELLKSLENINYEINGDGLLSLPHTINLSFPNINSEALMLALKGYISVSNGSACTSQSYEPSHVLTQMGFSKDRINSSIRLSWCHMTKNPNWENFIKILKSFD